MSIIKESHHTSDRMPEYALTYNCFTLLCMAIQGYFMYAYTFRLNLFFLSGYLHLSCLCLIACDPYNSTLGREIVS